MMTADALAPATAALLPKIAGRPFAADAYLAGSAALALHLRHRPVHGLDLMSAGNRLTSPKRRALLEELLAIDPETRIETARDGFLYARTGAGIGVRVYYYPYPLVDPERACEGLAVASLVDLGLMKLAAIISRGTRRDFADLYLLCRELPLEELLERSQEKFGHVRDFALQALKGLADRDGLPEEPLPRLAEPLAWKEVERWVEERVREAGRQRVGLPTGPPDG
jgi:hypothetical protein